MEERRLQDSGEKSELILPTVNLSIYYFDKWQVVEMKQNLTVEENTKLVIAAFGPMIEGVPIFLEISMTFPRNLRYLNLDCIYQPR